MMGSEMSKRRFFYSLQARMVVIHLLLILLVMEVAGSYLSHSLKSYYLKQHHTSLINLAGTLAGFVAQPLAQLEGSPAEGASIAQLDGFVRTFGETDVELAIVDRAGAVRSALPDRLLGQNLRSSPEVARALEGIPYGNTRPDAETGERKIYLATPVALQGRVIGAVYVVGSLGRIEATIGATRRILFTTTLLALVLSALLSYILARTITGPVKELTAQAGLLAAGDFGRLIRVRSGDEIGQLAGMFNHLSGRLKETLAEISAEKRKAEAILIHMADGILAVDRDRRVILANPAAAEMLGFDPGLVAGRPLGALVPDEGLAAALDEVLAGRREDASVRVAVHGGTVLRARLAPLKDPSGWVNGIVIVFHDITRQENLDRMRREFVANVSHELRTPLTTIKSYVETLLEGSIEPEVSTRFLSVVAAETDRMVRLVNDLLTLSQLDSGRLRWEFGEVSPEELIAAVCEKFADRCGRKGLTLSCFHDPGLPLVEGDRDRLEQILSNLLNNAVDFTPSGGRIEVSACRLHNDVWMTVGDSGIGIPPEDLPHIFERFYRVDKARSREFGGTGLGLSIAREIVEAHGGRIEISSTPGRGTQVRFSLPVEAAGTRGIAGSGGIAG